MSDDVVARAKAALEGVTRGPWERNGYHGIEGPEWADVIAVEHDCPGMSGAAWLEGGRFDKDVAFIVASRQLVPELIAEVERLRMAEVERKR